MRQEEVVKEITTIIRSYLPMGYKILLFGSQAEGTALPGSDIDIGILGKKKVPWNRMVQILEMVDKLPTKTG